MYTVCNSVFVPPTQCTFVHEIHSDCVVFHCLYTFCPAASPIPVVYIYIVIGCCLGVAVVIVGLIILVTIVLVCIFRGQL